MTTSAPTLTPNYGTAATYQAWGAGISAALAAVGLVKTTDTGQVDWTSATVPGSSSTFTAYEIWRFNDALQATRPVFIRMEYGTGSSVSTPAIRFSVGVSTNGAGVLNGSPVSTASTSFVSNVSMATSGTSGPCFFSGDGSYLTMALGGLFWNMTQIWFVVFLDRTRNADGTANGNGVVYGKWAASNSWAVETMSFTGAGKSALDTTVGGIQWPGTQWTTSVGPNGDVYLYPLTVGTPQPNSPALAVMGHYGPDIGPKATVTVTHLGATHTYLCMGSYVTAFGPSTTCSLALRYE